MHPPKNSGRRLTLLLATIFLCPGWTLIAAEFTFPSILGENKSPKHTQAVQFLHQNDYDNVIRLSTEILQNDSTDRPARLLSALAYVGKGENARAMEQAERVKSFDRSYAIEIYRNLALIYGKAGRFYLSLTCLGRARAIDETPELVYEMGMMYAAQGQAAKARTLMENALLTKPDYQNLSRLCLRMGDYSKAKTYAKLALDQNPKNEGALLLRGTSELLSGETDAAEATLRQLGHGNSDPGVVGHYLGLISLIRGDFDTALAEMDSLLKNSPKLREAHMISALCWQMKGKYAEARQSAAAVIAINPNDALAELVLASAWIGENRRDEAKRALGKAEAVMLEFNAPFIESLKIAETWDPARAGRLAIANFLLAEGQAGNTLSLLAAMNGSSSGESPFFAIVKARAEVAVGNRQGAVSIYTALVHDQGKLVTPLVELAQLAVADGNADQTKKYLLEAEKRAGDNIRFHLAAGGLAYQVGLTDLAEAQFRRVIALDPKSSAGYNQLAWILGEKRQQYAEALPFAITARQLDPSNPNTTDTLAWTNYQLGSYQEAAKLYQPLFNSLPHDSTILYHMSRVCEKTGRNAMAADLLEKALSLSEDFPAAHEAEAVLQSLWSAR